MGSGSEGDLLRVVAEAVHHLMAGESVAIAPYDRLLTTQQAADLLNVSRSHLVRLLHEGRIRSRWWGRIVEFAWATS